MSNYSLNSNFLAEIEGLKLALKTGASNGMGHMMEQAEKDAQSVYRWRQPGNYQATDKGGNEWEWNPTGLAAESITGFVVGPLGSTRNPPNLSASSEIIKNGTEHFDHQEYTDESLVSDPTPEEGKIIGILSMDANITPYLQEKELKGGSFAESLSAGQNVIVEVLAVNAEHYYQNIVAPAIAEKLNKI